MSGLQQRIAAVGDPVERVFARWPEMEQARQAATLDV
jgi:hypothetical protein